MLLHRVFAYPDSTNKMSPSSTLLYYPSLSFSCPPGHLYGGRLGEFGDWSRNLGEGRGVGEVVRGVRETENHPHPPPPPTHREGVYTTNMSPSSNLLYYPSLSLSCPPGNLWEGSLGEFGNWPRNPGEGRGVRELGRGMVLQQRTIPTPP